MEEEAKTAEKRQQYKDDKRKFDEAMDCILALERSTIGADDDSGIDDPMDDEIDLAALDDEQQSHGLESGVVRARLASSLASDEFH